MKGNERTPDSRHVARELAQFRNGDRLADGGVRRDLAQIGDQSRLVLFREKLEIDAECGSQLEQDRYGQWALIVFKLVEIAQRNTNRGGKRLLCQVSLLPQPLQTYPREPLLHRATPLQTSQALQICQFRFANLRNF